MHRHWPVILRWPPSSAALEGWTARAVALRGSLRSLLRVTVRVSHPRNDRLQPLAEIGRNVHAGVDQRLHCAGGFLEHGAFRAVELNLHDALDALGADHGRHADIEILDAVLAIEPGGTRQHSFFVLQ